MSEGVLGRGVLVSGSAFGGVVRTANTVDDVFDLMKSDGLRETILLVDSPSATAVVPLLPQVRGVVCLSGGKTSHLALVSREFGLPCVMDLSLLVAPGDVEGIEVTVTDSGELIRAHP